MRHIGICVLSGALILAVTGNPAAAATFDSCTSAYSYGANTAAMFVSAAMNRAACDPTEVQRAEAALARAFKSQAISPQNPESLKVCFYAGLYQGYVHTLGSERADCGQPLPLMSVARAAVAVFEAMFYALDSLDNAVVNRVFDGVFVAPGVDAAACDAYLRAEASDLNAGFGEFVDSVCWNG